MPDINDTLRERGSRYGEFADHARISQELLSGMSSTPGWKRLVPDQREALTLIAHKIARILNGDPNYDDSWRDIAGYATLITNRLLKEQTATNHPDYSQSPIVLGTP